MNQEEGISRRQLSTLSGSRGVLLKDGSKVLDLMKVEIGEWVENATLAEVRVSRKSWVNVQADAVINLDHLGSFGYERTPEGGFTPSYTPTTPLFDVVTEGLLNGTVRKEARVSDVYFKNSLVPGRISLSGEGKKVRFSDPRSS